MTRRAMIRFVCVTCIASAIAYGATLALRDGRTEGSALAVRSSPGVLVARPRRDASAHVIRLPAVAEPSEQALLYARVNGFIKERSGELGDQVRAGQVLAVIESPDLVWNSVRAKAALAQCEAQLVLARANLARAMGLISKAAVSRETLETRQAEAQAVQANRDAAEAEVRRLAELLNFREIKAPFDGVIVERRVERGDLAAGDQPQSNAYLFRLAQIDMLRVVVHVPQSDAARVESAESVRVRFPEFSNDTWTGRISGVSKLVDPSSGTMRVEIMTPNPGRRISAGMFAQAEFSDRTLGNLRLPSSTIISRNGAPHVARVVDGRVQFTFVTIGRDFGADLEVLHGVTEQDRVVINPNGLLRDGDAIAEAAEKA